MEDHYEFKDDVICPNCGHLLDEDECYNAGLYEDGHLEDESVFNLECPSCNNEMEIKTRIYYKFSAISI